MDVPDQIKVPKYGLKVKLNHVYPENRKQGFIPCFHQIQQLFFLFLRYTWYYIVHKLTGKSIIMDYIYPIRSKRIYGVPLGGIGSGTIGRGYRGEFCRFQLKPGIYEYNVVDANQFIVTIKGPHNETIFHSLLSTFPKKSLPAWESLINGNKCTYTGLYPRSWTEYDLSEYGIKLHCRQISPIIPEKYNDSSLPCAVFVWNIDNICDEERTVTLALTFKNGTGNKKEDKSSICNSSILNTSYAQGVILYQNNINYQCAYGLSIKRSADISISQCLHFNPNSSGIEPWIQLKNNGCFDKISTNKGSEQIFDEMACGVASKSFISPSSTQLIEMCLVWDMPTVKFLNKSKVYKKYYSENFYSLSSIVDYAFDNYNKWEDSIYEWQSPILNNTKLPDWYKTAIFNELYFLSDGGSIWLALDDHDKNKLDINDPRQMIGKFAYLEGHEYKMYNTYDVHFYASFALFNLFPKLQYSLQYEIRDAIFKELPEKVKILYNGNITERKKPNCVPHDIGDPGEEPFTLLNSYIIHDVSEWRDLNVKFVLQVFRDGFKNKNEPNNQYLNDMYNACYIIMKKTLAFDVDGDGLIENSGTPDQTFDTWIMHGASAYCGGLWLTALFAMIKICNSLNKTNDQIEFENLFEKARKSYERKLWNGKYYNFDCSSDEYKSIMADQLCGHWYLRSCGYEYEVFPRENVISSLITIYENNVLSFCNGNMGAVNGFIDGHIDDFTIQSEEVWTGTTYALSALMIYEGLIDEAFRTAGGMFKSMTEKFGLAFHTPEALYATKYYRSVGYMRPLSIWSMQLALNQHFKEKK